MAGLAVRVPADWRVWWRFRRRGRHRYRRRRGAHARRSTRPTCASTPWSVLGGLGRRGGRGQRRATARLSSPARSPRSATTTSSSSSQSAISRSSVGELRRPPAAVDAVLGEARPARAAPTACRSALRSTRADEPVAQQEGQHVVAVHPLGRRRVDLQPVAEAEDPLDPRPLPDQRVEGLSSARARIQRGPAGRRVQPGRPAPAVDRRRAAARRRRPARRSRCARRPGDSRK